MYIDVWMLHFLIDSQQAHPTSFAQQMRTLKLVKIKLGILFSKKFHQMKNKTCLMENAKVQVSMIVISKWIVPQFLLKNSHQYKEPERIFKKCFRFSRLKHLRFCKTQLKVPSFYQQHSQSNLHKVEMINRICSSKQQKQLLFDQRHKWQLGDQVELLRFQMFFSHHQYHRQMLKLQIIPKIIQVKIR